MGQEFYYTCLEQRVTMKNFLNLYKETQEQGALDINFNLFHFDQRMHKQ